MLSCVFGGPASWQAAPIARLRERLEIYVLRASNEREFTCNAYSAAQKRIRTLGSPSRENYADVCGDSRDASNPRGLGPV